MDGTRMQALAYKGYRISAAKIGLPHAHYRPSGPLNPLAAGNLLGNLPASFSADNYQYKRPNGYAHPTWTALVDGALTQVGDYLKGPSGTFFIVAQQALLPILTVECNHTVSILRPHAADGIGVLPPGGDEVANELPVMTAWPASLLQGTKGERGDVNLPGDVKTAWSAILLPAVAGVLIHADDVLMDDMGRRHVISSTELTDLGWRLTAAYAGT